MKTKKTKTAKAVQTARAKITARPNDGQRATLTLRRVATSNAIADGWTVALETRGGGVTLLGEMQLSAFLATDKRDGKAEVDARKSVNEDLRKIAARLTDLPHLLAAAWKVCKTTGFRPCRTLALCGAGAAAKVADIDAVRERKSELATALKTAQTAFIEATTAGKKTDSLRVKMIAASKAVADYAPTAKAAEKEYRVTARDAVAILNSMADLRNGDDA